MELTEALHRVLLGHLKLILFCTLLGATAGIAIHLDDVGLSSATTRLVLDAPDPDSQAASQVLADTVRGIATSTEAVRTALRAAGSEVTGEVGPSALARDPQEVAQDHVEVAALGSSGVLALTVTDRDPLVAVALSRALAQTVIDTRNELTGGRSATVLSDLNVQIDSLTARITTMNDGIVAIDVQIDGASDQVEVLRLESQRGDLVRSLIDLTNRRSVLVAEHAKVASDQALRPQAAILDPARGPAEHVPSRVIPDAVLGSLLGLLFGVALAALIETFRPTIVGRSSFERETNAPMLGELAVTPDRVSSADLKTLAIHATLAAQTARVNRIELIGTDASIDLHLLAQELDSSMASPASNGRAVIVAPFGPNGSANGGDVAVNPKRRNERPGLILVAPSAMKRSSLEPVLDLRSISGMPLIGIINYQQPRTPHRPQGTPNGVPTGSLNGAGAHVDPSDSDQSEERH